MSWDSIKRRISKSAVDFALNAFWVAVWAGVCTAAAAGILFLNGTSGYVLVGLGAVAITLAGVVCITAAVVFLQRRARRASASLPPRVGRRGFIDYKIQGLRALGRITTGLTAMTYEINRVTRGFAVDAKRLDRLQKRGGNMDERAYRAVKKAARRLEKRAAAMNLHATKYAIDVDLFVEGASKWIDWVVAQPEANRREFVDFARVLQAFRTAMESSIPKMESFRAVIESGREASEEMDLAGGFLNQAISAVIEATRKASAFCAIQIPRLTE